MSSEDVVTVPVVAALSGERYFRTGRRHIIGVTQRRASVFSRLRDLDWGMAGLAILLGIMLFQRGIHVQVGTDGSWTSGISTHGWAWILIVLGAIRAAAIRINGAWRTSISALIRAGAAVCGMAFWGQIFYASLFSDLSRDVGMVSIFTGIFAWFWLVEFRCVIRALDDAGSIRRANRKARMMVDAGK